MDRSIFSTLVRVYYIFNNGIISIRREIDEDREEENRDADIKIMVFDKFPFFIPKDTWNISFFFFTLICARNRFKLTVRNSPEIVNGVVGIRKRSKKKKKIPNSKTVSRKRTCNTNLSTPVLIYLSAVPPSPSSSNAYTVLLLEENSRSWNRCSRY